MRKKTTKSRGSSYSKNSNYAFIPCESGALLFVNLPHLITADSHAERTLCGSWALNEVKGDMLGTLHASKVSRGRSLITSEASIFTQLTLGTTRQFSIDFWCDLDKNWLQARRSPRHCYSVAKSPNCHASPFFSKIGSCHLSLSS